jgi:hypothetical protein
MDAWLEGIKDDRGAAQACLERKKPTPEMANVAAHPDASNGWTRVETIGEPEDRSGDQRPAVMSRNPLKRRTKDDVVLGTPEGWMFEKRRRTQPKCKNGIRNRGLQEQLRLTSKRAFNKTVRQTLRLEIANRAVEFPIGLRKASNWTL